MIRENITQVREQIAAACARAKRDPAEVTLAAVTKGRTVEELRQALEAGIVIIGENRVQEAAGKFNCLRPSTFHLPPFKWHMIGHLQTNKVREAVRMFDLIQSVDSARLAQEIDRQAAAVNKIQNVLIEIKTSPEATKYGILPEEAPAVVADIAGLKNIRIQGLMAIAPIVENAEQARPYFHMLRELRDQIFLRPSTFDLRPILSMGMTNDFEVAIEEGATMVRLGRAIFG